MAELEPVDLYINCEVWQHEDGRIGFRLRSELDEKPDLKILASVFRELSSEILRSFEDSEIAASILMFENGSVHVDWDRARDFAKHDNYILTRHNLLIVLATLSRQNNIKKKNGYRMSWIYRLVGSCIWLFRKLLNSFEPYQKPPPAAGSTANTPLNDKLSEASKGTNAGSEASVGNVVWLPNRNHKD